jgi:hypothetical protein
VTETNVFQLSRPGTFVDPLTEVLRSGARELLAHAVEAEVAALPVLANCGNFCPSEGKLVYQK